MSLRLGQLLQGLSVVNGRGGTQDLVIQKMGHKVKRFDEKTTTPKDLIESKADMLLFFKGGVKYGVTADLLAQTLKMIDYPKVCWYWDKVWGDRVEWIQKVAMETDLMFLSDGTFVRTNNYLNMYELHQGMDERYIKEGKERDEFKCDLAFTGSVYGERETWYKAVKKMYGDRFGVFNNVFNEDLNDLCASAKIITAPEYPQEDYYYSQRPYEIMGRGGFMLYPYLRGLAEQFEEGKEIEFYRSPQEFREKVDYYLANPKERERIRKAGQKKVKDNYTFRDTIKQTIDLL